MSRWPLYHGLSPAKWSLEVYKRSIPLDGVNRPFPTTQSTDGNSQNTPPPQGGNTNSNNHAKSSSTTQVLMCNEMINLTTRSKAYDPTPNQNTSGSSKENLCRRTLLCSSIIWSFTNRETYFWDSIVPLKRHNLKIDFQSNCSCTSKLQYSWRSITSTLCYVNAWSSPTLAHAA